MESVGKAAAARKLASAAAYGGGRPLRARRRPLRRAAGPRPARPARPSASAGDAPPPDATGWYGRGRPGPAIKVALLGDSSAAGYGVERVEETPGALLASGVAERADRRVYLRAFAVVGARSSDLGGQVDRALPIEPDVAVILIGANDVTHRVRPGRRRCGTSPRRYAGCATPGVAVLVGTCPDLGTVKPIPPPLKQVARTWSRRLAAAQTIAVLESGGRTVSLGSILGPEFAAAPALLFGPDQFHPSAAGYRSLAAVLLPSTLAALGLIPEDEAAPEALRGEGVLPITDRRAPGGQHARHRARRHRGRRPRAAAYAASGSSCGTAAGSRSPRAEAPGETEAPGADEETRAGGYRLGMTETQREPVPRVDTSEKDTALSFLRFARHCLVKKTEGLDDEQLRRVLVPSGTSLLGLVQHVTDGERSWFGYNVAGDAQWSEVDFGMEMPPDRPTAEVFAAFDEAVAASEEILAGVPDLDAPLAHPGRRRAAERALGRRAHDQRDRPARRPRRHPARADRRRDRALAQLSGVGKTPPLLAVQAHRARTGSFLASETSRCRRSEEQP